MLSAINQFDYSESDEELSESDEESESDESEYDSSELLRLRAFADVLFP